MATPGVKLDDGTGGFVTKCFPVRGMLGKGDSGSGAWLVAHRADQRRRFKAVLCTKPRTYDQIHEERRRAEKQRDDIVRPSMCDMEEEEEEEKVLDGFFLMKHCCIDDPADLCSINVSGQGFTEVKEEDFALFDNVAYVNASENILQLESFNHFPIIRELEMPLNGLRGLKIHPGDFPNLEMLDLSYNNLSPTDLLPLGLLPRLRILHLTGNGLQSLPVDLAHTFIDVDSGKRMGRFESLQILMLDDNRLCNVATFAALAGLRRLMHLDMSKNEIYSIPQLMVVHGRHVTTDEDSSDIKKSKRSGNQSHRGSRRSKSRSTGITDRKTPTNSPNPLGNNSAGLLTVSPADGLASRTLGTEADSQQERDSKQDRLLSDIQDNLPGKDDMSGYASGPKQSIEDFNFDDMGDLGEINLSDLDARIDKEVREEVEEEERQQGLYNDVGPLPPPFPELRHVNLSHNKIHDEHGLLASVAWPVLAELVIHDNPLTRNSSGDPPLLKKHLHSRLGVKIIRKKPPPTEKPLIEVQQNPERKVETNIPRIPKRDIDKELLALEAPLRPALTDKPASPNPPRDKTQPNSPGRPLSGTKPLPPITTEQKKGWVSAEADTTNQDNSNQQSDAFFMTQVDDQGEEKFSNTQPPDSKQQETKRQPNPKYTNERYKGYEELLDIDEEGTDDVLLPKDLRSNVQALQYTLNHPLLFRENKVHLNKPQKPFYPHQKEKASAHIELLNTRIQHLQALSVPKTARTTMPRPPPRKTKAQQVDEILSQLKDRSMVQEANLSDVLSGSSKLQHQFEDAPALLGKVQRRYNKVRVTSMKSAKEFEAKKMKGMLQEMVEDVHRMKLGDRTKPVLAK